MVAIESSTAVLGSWITAGPGIHPREASDLLENLEQTPCRGRITLTVFECLSYLNFAVRRVRKKHRVFLAADFVIYRSFRSIDVNLWKLSQ